MDVKKFFSFKSQPVENDPTALLAGTPEDTLDLSTPEALNRAAESLTQVAATALNAAGVRTAESIRQVSSRPAPERGPTEADDMVRHILGDNRIRTIMQSSRMHRAGLRRATT